MSIAPSSVIVDNCILDNFNKQCYLGNQYVSVFPPSTTVGSSETPLFYLNNPAGNKKALYSNLRKLTCLTASQNVYFNLYINPTISVNGTPLGIVNTRTGSSFVSIGKAFSSPTATNFGTYIASLASPSFVENVSTGLLIIDPGYSLLLTSVASAGSTALTAEVSWYEL